MVENTIYCVTNKLCGKFIDCWKYAVFYVNYWWCECAIKASFKLKNLRNLYWSSDFFFLNFIEDYKSTRKILK